MADQVVVKNTQSVLDAMTSGVLDRKKQAATVLTPVGQERPRVDAPSSDPFSGPIDAAFPWDYPRQWLTQGIAHIRQELAFIESGLVAMEATIGVPTLPADSIPMKPKVKASNLADEPARIAAAEIANGQKERLAAAAKAAAAQASVFTPAGWNCPEHDKFVTKTSRLGREYRACPACKEFEKPS